MRIWFAKLRYWHSLVNDMSEYPVAGIRRRERVLLLRERIGDNKAEKVLESSGNWWALLACALSPMTWFVMAIGVGFFLALAGPGLWR